jgi:hypothetical protein
MSRKESVDALLRAGLDPRAVSRRLRVPLWAVTARRPTRAPHFRLHLPSGFPNPDTNGRARTKHRPHASSLGPDGLPLYPPGRLTRSEWIRELVG